MEETRYQRIGREQRERREARELAAKKAAKKTARKPRAKRNPVADRIDGYDRDDLGLSVD